MRRRARKGRDRGEVRGEVVEGFSFQPSKIHPRDLDIHWQWMAQVVGRYIVYRVVYCHIGKDLLCLLDAALEWALLELGAVVERHGWAISD
jgi:hypothetical protein